MQQQEEQNWIPGSASGGPGMTRVKFGWRELTAASIISGFTRPEEWRMRILTEALTFDDVSLVPAYSNVLPRDVNLSTRLTNDIRLNIPILSAAMDSVTEARLAITMAQSGGIGIIHKNMPIEQQAAEVRLVKKFEAGVIRDPITVGPETSIGEVMAIVRSRNISGVPVVDGEKLVGIVTSRDLR